MQGGYVLSPGAPLERSDVRIESGKIVEVGANLGPGDEDVIDASECIVTPGLINAHTHSGQSVQKGAAPNLPLEIWIGCVLYGDSPFAVEDVYTAAAVTALDLLHTGCTSLLDHVFLDVADLGRQAEAVISAYIDTGIRANVAPVVQDLDYITTVATGIDVDIAQPEPVMSPRDAPALIGSLRAYVNEWADRHPRIAPMVGPAAPQRCSDELLAGIAELSSEQGIGIHTHLLESKSQVIATRARFGRSVVDHLAELGLLRSGSSFAHAIWLDAPEYQALARAGVTLVHNPIAALRCGSGILPLQELPRLGLEVALGADGAAANDGQNMFETIKLASLLHTLYGDFRAWLQPSAIWTLGLRGGAAALGRRIGAIVPGSEADVVLLRADAHELRDKDRLVRSLVLSEDGRAVETVIVAGEVVLEHGVSTRVDERALRARARDLRRRWHAEHATRTALFERVEPFLAAVVDAAEQTDLGFSRRARVTLSAENGLPEANDARIPAMAARAVEGSMREEAD